MLMLTNSDKEACHAGVQHTVNNSDREKIAAAWIKAGLAEHASVAAFSRFVLQLLSLGAPAALVSNAIVAMEDEVRHAMVCFGMARRWSGKAHGPGPLNISTILDNNIDENSIVYHTIVEGCIGETIAARLALRGSELSIDHETKVILAKIAIDEERHAELGWRFVEWTFTRNPAFKTKFTSQIVGFIAGLRSAQDEAKCDEKLLSQYGHLVGSTRQQVIATALEEAVIPRLEQLFGDQKRS
jgi:hypothetical protein